MNTIGEHAEGDPTDDRLTGLRMMGRVGRRRRAIWAGYSRGWRMNYRDIAAQFGVGVNTIWRDHRWLERAGYLRREGPFKSPGAIRVLIPFVTGKVVKRGESDRSERRHR